MRKRKNKRCRPERPPAVPFFGAPRVPPWKPPPVRRQRE